jgi:hypothetical protein
MPRGASICPARDSRANKSIAPIGLDALLGWLSRNGKIVFRFD